MCSILLTWMLSIIVFEGSHLEPTGLAAAKMAVRAFSWQRMPAFAILKVCCSITSCKTERVESVILSNSSIQQVPLSARTGSRRKRNNNNELTHQFQISRVANSKMITTATTLNMMGYSDTFRSEIPFYPFIRKVDLPSPFRWPESFWTFED